MSHDNINTERELGKIVKEQYIKSFRKLRAARETDYDMKKK